MDPGFMHGFADELVKVALHPRLLKKMTDKWMKAKNVRQKNIRNVHHYHGLEAMYNLGYATKRPEAIQKLVERYIPKNKLKLQSRIAEKNQPKSTDARTWRRKRRRRRKQWEKRYYRKGRYL